MKIFTSLIRSFILLSGLFFYINHVEAQSNSSSKALWSPSNCKSSPEPLTIQQADGTSLTVIGKGNMNNHWTETTDGYSIVRNSKGIYEYAVKQNGDLIAGGMKASDPSQRNFTEQNHVNALQQSLKPDFNPLKSSILNQVNAQLQNKTYPATGNIRVIALLIDYPDLNNTYPSSTFDSLLYGQNYRSGDGSFKTFYETSSDGQISITVDVFGWYRADSSYIWYGNDSGSTRAADLVREAVDAGELAGVDYSLYDNNNDGDVDGILAVHAGPGAESGSQTQFIWSHRWVLNGGSTGSVIYDGVFINDYMINPETRGTIASPRTVGIGVFCHEFGHNLGLPDLYDTDNTNGDSEGIGEWGLMGSAGWLGGEHRPGDFSAWAKVENAWITPTQLTIGNTGLYTMHPATSNQYEIFQVNTALTNEYFLLENRQQTGLDRELNGSGLAIWHINTSKTNAFGNQVNGDETLKGVDLEEADGNDDLDNEINRGDAGDLFPGSANNTTFDDATTPNANNYTLANTNLQIRSINENAGVINFSFGAVPGPPCAASTTFTTNTGSFNDGSGAGFDYVNNQNCSWLIQPTSGTVTLSFTSFDTEAGIDTLTVYDGPNNTSPVLGNFSGNTIPMSVTSTSNVMYVEFNTNATINGPGWDASYITNSTSTGCTGTTTLTAASGNFSDGSGASNYANNLNCSWLIQPAGASSITFGLTNLNTEISNDRIRVYDGANNSAPQLGSYSGTNNLNTLTSSGGVMFVEFTTNGSVTDAGWDAFYSSSTSGPGCTGSTTLTANTGSFSDGSMANNYDNNQFCSWLIQPSSGTVTLSFSNFATEATFDRVIVFDGIDNTAPQIGNFSGSSLPPSLTSSANSMYIEFRTNGTTTDAGWDASYITNTVTPTCSGTTNLTAASGTFDDGSGNGVNYSDNLNCSWLIQPPGANGVTINFTSFDTESNVDFLRIYNGTNNSAPLVATLSGNAIPPNVSVSSGDMFIEFITNGSVNSSGWTASYTSSTPPTCSGVTTFTTPSGTFDDGSGTANYDNNLSCGWLIQPAGSPAVITLSFSNMNLSNFGDRVNVYDGSSNTGTLLASYFFNNTGSPVNAYSGSMYIEFRTDANFTGNGWDASYSSSSTFCTPLTTLTANFGNFTDGSPFGQNYQNNTSCEWLIQPTAANVAVNLTFFQFDTELNNDTVTIYDGATTASPILATYSGNNPGLPSVLSTGGSMLVTFKSNGSVVATGWSANYNTQPRPACSGTTTLTAASGTFDDGTTATTNYTNNLNCSWLIQPAGASIVSLSFNRIATANFDEVVVYDGTSNTAPVLGTYSGSTLPPTITSTGGAMFVEFTTNGFGTDLGWEADYNSSSSQCFSNLSLTTYNGTVEDGSGTSNYQNNLNCSWIIEPALATSITLNFNNFDVNNAGDTLYVYDGNNSSAPLLGKFTGNTLPSSISSTGGTIFIQFITDGSLDDLGWEFSYTSTIPISCAGLTTFTAPSASFEDGSGTSNYDNNLNCSWLIQPTGNPAVIVLTMNSMNLANFGDRVRVYDGTSNAGIFLGSFFFNNTGSPLTAFSGSMFVEFDTDNFNTAQGWDATYTTSNSYCQLSTTFTNNFGNFNDGSPFGQNYLDNTDCRWLIQPTTPNVAVRLNFTNFDTEAINDTVTIYDGTSTTDPILATFSGSITPPIITSSGGAMLVTFKSNGSITNNGWSAFYQTQPIPACAGRTNLTAASGTFDDGSGTGNLYVENSNCSWLINPPGAFSVDINFNYFTTEIGNDILSIYDGTDNTAPLLGTYSGNTNPPSLTANSGSMFLEFTTNGFTNAIGWEASYTSANSAILDAVEDTVFINAGAGSTSTFNLNSNTSWSTSDNATWLIPTPVNGSGTQMVSLLAIQPNIGPERSALVFVDETGGSLKDTVVVIQRTSGRFIDANPDTLFFAATMAPSQSISLNTNVTWNLASTATWLSFAPASGTNNGTPSVSVQDNTTNQIRTDFIVISGNLGASNDTVFVVQDAVNSPPPSLSVNPNVINLAQAMGSNSSFTVNSTVVWQTQSGATWLTVTNPANTSDTNTVQIMANSMNASTSPRSTFVAVQDVGGTLFDTVFVDQLGGSLILSPTPRNVTINQASGSNATVSLSSNVNWTATSAGVWLNVTPTTGNGNTSLTVSANSANASSNTRNSFIALDGGSGAILDTIFVEQLGNTQQLSVAPSNITLAQAMGSLDSFIVNSNVVWQVSSGATWLTANAPFNSFDTNKVEIIANSMNPNPNPRSSFIAVENVRATLPTLFDTVFVTQLGTTPVLSGAPDTIMLPFSSGSVANLSLTASGNWTAIEGDLWFSLNQSSGTGSANLTLTANSNNTTGSQRLSFVALADNVNNLSDTVIVIQDTLSNGLATTPDTIRISSTIGSTNTFDINTSLNWNANIVGPLPSISLSQNAGSGNTTITVTALSPNNTLNDRLSVVEVLSTGTPVIRDTVWVIQEGIQPILTATPDVINLGFSSGSNDIVSLSSNIPWTVNNPAAWLSVNPLTGNGNTTLNITANSDNLTGSDRTATVTIDGVSAAISETITVTQIDGSSPSFNVSKDTVFVDNPQGSTGSFSILSNASSWTISENTSWLLINPTSGSNTQTITALVATRNVLGIPRYANLTASAPGFPDRTVVIAQKEATPLFQIAPASVLIAKDSSSKAYFNISSNLPSWNITENVTWLEVDPLAGAFTQRITITAVKDNNTGAQRTETVTISAPPLVPQTVMITQDTARFTGIDENLFESEFALFPNPTSGQITLKIGDQFIGKTIELSLFNLLGEEVAVNASFDQSNTTRINLNNQANGIYFLMVKYDNKVFSRKISVLK